MLKADLNFYPDARVSDGSKLGVVLFAHQDNRRLVLFIPARGFKAASASVEDPVLLNIFNDITPYLGRLGSGAYDDDISVANAIASRLPHNLRLTDPTPLDEATTDTSNDMNGHVFTKETDGGAMYCDNGCGTEGNDWPVLRCI